ncbi:SpoIIE family protein phosphatase [Terasakiella sp. A23]|uniref:SpoIIE family protein phosphatase n=1 Tax=Terasakiella sp. FCG-A23 TaxID=3080561 RepID=UPI002954D79F|nr:SpoIIE family protein phosphatase [Terasakiella sp. A23]MDV7339243.1 SpoIIE family protein phosphatase [Terasakiella sp. A23]
MVKIICIEDEEILRFDICDELREAGYDVYDAADGQQGLHLIQTQCPDLVLCDIRMPVMGGYELLSKVRQSDAPWGTVPFLFLTAYGERDDMIKGLTEGADDFLTKPIDYEVLLARIETSLRQVKRVKDLEKRSFKEMETELNRAHEMQRDLLPSNDMQRAIELAYNLKLTSHYEPSRDLGGDIWGVHMISPQKVMIYLVDFSGHGVAAAMNTFRLSSKMDSDPIGEETPAEYLGKLNKWLCEQLQTGQYATVLLGVLDVEQQSFEYAAAGTTTPIRLNRQKAEIEIGCGKGVPLGMMKSAVYENRRLEIRNDDAIFLFSDALLEHGRKEKLNLGQDGVEKLLRQTVQSSDTWDVEGILTPFLAQAPRPLDDDLTAVCCVCHFN